MVYKAFKGSPLLTPAAILAGLSGQAMPADLSWPWKIIVYALLGAIIQIIQEYLKRQADG